MRWGFRRKAGVTIRMKRMGSIKPLGTTERQWLAAIRYAAFIFPGMCYFGVWAFIGAPKAYWVWPALATAITGAIGLVYPEKVLGFFADLIKGKSGTEDP